MITPEKLSKLVDKMQQFSHCLIQHHDITMHRCVDQFFYLEKSEELLILSKQLEQARVVVDNLTQRLHMHYTKCFYQWRHDVRWVNTHLEKKRKK